MTTSTLSDSIGPGIGARTASIIQFPVRPKPQPSAQASKPGEAPVVAPEDRLARALDSLNAALSDQRTAVAAWREVLGELKATTTSLDESLRRYRTNLKSLGTSVSALHVKARSLEQWADSVIAAD